MSLPHIVVSDADNATVIAPIGEFDLANVEMLRSTIREAITPESNKIVLDLSGITFADSTALGVIIGAAKSSAGLGGWLRLVNPRPNVHKVLTMMSIDTVIGLYDTIEQATSHRLTRASASAQRESQGSTA